MDNNKLFKAQNKSINLKGHIGRIKINSNQVWDYMGDLENPQLPFLD